jgi:hypothetical protein
MHPVFEIPESWHARTTERPSFYILKERRIRKNFVEKR